MKIRMLFTALIVSPALAIAGVNPKNGDFYISYADIEQKSDAKSGERELDLERTYNSKSTGIGWFGYGWGTGFERRILAMPDGSVVVQENGGSGAESYYAPQDGAKLQAGVEKIVAVAAERDKLGQEAAELLRKKLLADESLRRAKVIKYGIQSQLQAGDRTQSSGCAKAFVARVGDEYRRTTCGSEVDYFDLEGRLLQKEDGEYKITLHYAGKYPDRIEDSLGQKLFLKWNAAGHVEEARSEKPAPVVNYLYDDKDNLLKSNTVGGVFYQYEYDAKHNLTRIGYIDGTHKDMEYNEKSLITSVADSDGSKTLYSYREEPGNPSHYWTTTTFIGPSGEESSQENEYSLATDANGVERLVSLTRSEGQRKKDVVLDEEGRVKRVRNPDGGYSEYSYDPVSGKISSVSTEDGKTDFKYDQAGNLIRAENDRGQLITLSYDDKKHVTRLVASNKAEHKRRELQFKYGDLGKPSQIKLLGKGEINVEYDEQGEIARVESKQGAKIAISVSEAMMELMKVVRVAGVDLGL